MGGNTQVSQRQIDETARNLLTASDQLRASRETQLAGENKEQQRLQGDAARMQHQRRMERVQASVKAQQAKNAAEATQVRQNDHVVIDLERISRPEQQTVALRNEFVRLHQAGAHYLSGRVANVENTPNGIFYTVETENMTQRVPAAAVVRADVFAEENPDFNDET
jgi:hypothetical protein